MTLCIRPSLRSLFSAFSLLLIASFLLLGSAPAAAATEETGTITGTVLLDDGRPADGYVGLQGIEFSMTRTIGIGEGGGFRIDDVPVGRYTLSFSANHDNPANADYVTEYWGDTPYRSQAAYFTVDAGQTLSGMDAVLVKGGSISGRVTGADGEPLHGAQVSARIGHNPVHGIMTDDNAVVAETDSSGNYTLRAIAPGDWHIGFTAVDGIHRSEWWSNKPHLDSSDLIRVRGRDQVTEVNAQLPAARPATSWGSTSRIHGADRYATAVAVSRAQFSPGVPVAYIAAGSGFADALAGAPLAVATRGPVLLTKATSLPSDVAAELRRLAPRRIVVLGGSGVVSEGVVSTLRRLTAGSVTRLAGADRYETSVAISASRWQPGVQAVYLASGSSFPDALAGAPAAGLADGPVLLTGRDRLPPAVRREIQRLRPGKIVILGGPGVVGVGVTNDLRGLSWRFDIRISGPDRYATSAAVADNFDTGIEVVYIASGGDFPDALAAAPVAGLNGAPILLTDARRLSPTVVRQLTRLRPQRIVVLGGPGAVSSAVEAQLRGLR